MTSLINGNGGVKMFRLNDDMEIVETVHITPYDNPTDSTYTVTGAFDKENKENKHFLDSIIWLRKWSREAVKKFYNKKTGRSCDCPA